MSTDQRVSFGVTDSIAHLQLVRAAARNAIDPAMGIALDDATAACAADPTVRVLLISADGPAFTVGGDLRHFAAHTDDLPAAMAAMLPSYHRTLARLARLDVPVVCAVQGAVAGGGLGLAWVADVLLAADDAVFATAFAQIGLSGDGGSSWFLPRLVGLRRAQEMLIGGRTLNAAEALEWGLVTRVVPRAELAAEAATLAGRLASGPTVALAQMRHLLRRSLGASIEEQLAAETTAMDVCSRTTDAREGIAAFVARRPPRFDGQSRPG